MSVINKMLRDLDNRQTPPNPANGREGAMPLDPLAPLQGVLPGRRSGQIRRGLTAVTSVLTVMGALGWWYLNQPTPTPPSGDTAVGMAPAPVAVVVPAAPVAPVAQVAAVTPPPPEVVKPSLKSPPSAPVVAPTPQAQVVARPEPAVKPPVAPAPTNVVAAQTAAPIQAQSVGPVAAAISAPRSNPRPSTAHDVLVQAQGLWAQGDREAAISLLEEALVIAEKAGTGKAQVAVLLPLARELARMQIAMGQVAPALDLLTRLESPLSGAPDIWAMRGNAAQRLGRHSESVSAYQAALKLQPDEPRWLQGVAVSLAAQGQLDLAAQWAEKARSVGGLRPDVANYLRQLGVSVP